MMTKLKNGNFTIHLKIITEVFTRTIKHYNTIIETGTTIQLLYAKGELGQNIC